jgi:hypothetical protein
MKNFGRWATSFLLVAFVSVLTLPLTPWNAKAEGGSQDRSASRQFKVKTGSEAVARVGILKQNNKNLRAALSIFEKRGHKPKIENSTVVTDKLSDSDIAFLRKQKGTSQATFEKAVLRPQQSVGSPEGEIVFIPTLELPGEWQGTIIITAYDEYGNFVNDYTANVVLTQVPGTYDWEAKYEVGVDGGVPYLSWEEGMYTAFQLGTSIQNQPPPPTTLLNWQQFDPSFNPKEGLYETGPYNPRMDQMARLDGTIFQKASFLTVQAGDRGGDYRYRQGRCPCDPPPAVRSWFGCTAAVCAGSAATCVFAGTFTPVCVLSRCGGGGVGCAVRGIFGW